MTTYYIDPDLGSDANDGLSEGAPKKSLPTSSSGNTYKLKRGGVFSSSSQWSPGGHNITISAYGEGSRPKIINTNGVAIYMGANSGVLLDGLYLENVTYVTPTLRLAGSVNMRIVDCEIVGGSSGVHVYLGTVNPQIIGCVIHDTADDNVSIGECASGEIRGCTMYRPDLANATGDNIHFWAGNNWGVWSVVGNTLTQEFTNKHAIMVGLASGTSSVLISENEIHSALVGVHVRDVATVTRNRITLRGSAQLFGVQADPSASAKKIVIESNLIIVGGDYAQSIGVFVNDGGAGGFTFDVSIYGNSIIGNLYRGVMVDSSVDAGSVTIKNNVLVGDVGVSMSAGISKTTGALATISASNNAVSGFGTALNNVTDAAAVTADPQLTATYRPKSTSPLLGAGTHLGYRRDIDGKQRPNPPSIGAYDIATMRIV